MKKHAEECEECTSIYVEEKIGEPTYLFMYIYIHYVWKDTQEINNIKLALGMRTLWPDQGENDIMLELWFDCISYLKIYKM